MRIGIANAAEVDALWPKLAGRFQEAIDACGDDLALGDLWQMCRSGDAFLVCAIAGEDPVMGAVLQFQKWSKGPVLRCLVIGGEQMAAWLPDWIAAVRNMMREGGATRFVFDGRDGWSEVLRRSFEHARKLRATYEVEI